MTSRCWWAIAIVMVLASCEKKHPTGTDVIIEFDEFPQQAPLEGTFVEIEGPDVYVPGKAKVLSDGYMFYLYDCDYFLSVTDTCFRETAKVAFHGPGPNEINGVGMAFGQSLDDHGNLLVYDPYTFHLYSYSTTDSTATLNQILEMPSEMAAYTPFNVIKLNNGNYVSPRGDFKYGMIAWDPETGMVKEWPLGLTDVNPEEPEYNHVSMRVTAYNKKHGLLSEIYGQLPTVILHDDTGNVVNTITINGLEPDLGKVAKDYDILDEVVLTDKLIWILYENPMDEDTCIVLVMDYDYSPLAKFEIAAAQTIAVDEKRGKLIAVHANSEEYAIMAYDIPKNLM